MSGRRRGASAPSRRVRAMRAFVLGLLVGAIALIAAALILGP